MAKLRKHFHLDEVLELRDPRHLRLETMGEYAAEKLTNVPEVAAWFREECGKRGQAVEVVVV